MSSAKNRDVTADTITEVFDLARLLGEYGQIKRMTKLPSGELEPDSHHSFNLALIAYDLAAKHAPELDREKLLIYALVHDLPELISGDQPTLTATSDQLKQKASQDEIALAQVLKRFKCYPSITHALQQYEDGSDEESHFIYWLDKMVTIPTHFFDGGSNLRQLGIANRRDIKDWYERALEKLGRRTATAPAVPSQVLKLAYQRMHDELLED